MKKILNDPFSYAEETLQGLCRAYPQYYRLVPDTIARDRPRRRPDQGQGRHRLGRRIGSSADLYRLCRAGVSRRRACGDVFASPSADEMATAMRAADGGAGVLRLYGNYGGDVMNFDMAGDLAEMDGITQHHRASGRRRGQRAAGRAREAPRRRRHGADLQDRRRGGRGGSRPRRRHGGRAARRRWLPHDGRGAIALHGSAGRQADLHHRRRRDGNRHGHPWRTGRAAAASCAGERDRRRDARSDPCRSGAVARRRASPCW